MYCKDCRLKIPFNKAPNLVDCSICGKPLTADSRDILEFGKYGLVNEVRPTQVEMAQDIEALFSQERGTLIAEGGTGIGKSFAYLLPTILDPGKRVIISTAKKGLQDQLVKKDLPLLFSKLGINNMSFGVYKGKSNYACWKLKTEVPQGEQLRFERFISAAQTKRVPADIAEWSGPPPRWWSKISIDNCALGNRCAFFRDCRPHPKDYNIVVTNHHLTAIDLKVHPGTLFGHYDALILDEAHQAPEAFRSAYSRSVTFTGINRIDHALQNDDYLRSAIDDSGITTAQRLTSGMEDIKSNFNHLHHQAQIAVTNNTTIDTSRIQGELKAFQEETDEYAGRLFMLTETFNRELKNQDTPDGKTLAMVSRSMDLHKRVTSLIQFASDLTSTVSTNPEAEAPPEFLTTWDNRGLHTQPLDVGRIMAKPLSTVKYKIMMSATLAMGNDFEFSKRRLGLSDDLKSPKEIITEKVYGSPFDLRKQAILYIPRHIPLPAYSSQQDERSRWIRDLATEIAQLITATEGDAFVLFSAKTDMRDIQTELGYDFWQNAELNLILHEGDATATLNKYMETPRSVLFGLKSFWEGVDVSGDKLKLVIIPKLPFPNPHDPLIAALSEKAGHNSFQEVMVPQMVFDMKQGVGRLIRTQTDKGFVAILDPRIWTGTGNRMTHLKRMERINADPNRKRMGYGKQLLDVLGYTQVTDTFTTVQEYAKSFFNGG